MAIACEEFANACTDSVTCRSTVPLFLSLYTYYGDRAGHGELFDP